MADVTEIDVSEKLERIDTNVTEMRTTLGLTEANTIEELTAKVKDTITGGNNAKFEELNSNNTTGIKLISEINNISFTSNVTKFYSLFQNFSGLKKISFDQNSDFSNVTNMYGMFSGCTSLKTIPNLNTSNVTDISYMFDKCSSLTEIPQMDTSNATTMYHMFSGCTSLKTIPQMNTSKVTNMSYMFSDCTSLTEIPEMDTSNVTDMYAIFNRCTSLTTVPEMDTSNVTVMYAAFMNCSNLITIPVLNLSSATQLPNFLYNCSKVENIGGFIDLGKNYSTTNSSAYSSYTLSLNKTIATHDSLMNVINGLYDIATKGCNPQKLVLGSTLLAKLTSEEIAIATNKGWTVS